MTPCSPISASRAATSTGWCGTDARDRLFELDRLAVGRHARRAVPGRDSVKSLFLAHHLLCFDEFFKRRKPGFIVASLLIGSNFASECRRPFRPGEDPLFMQADGHGEGLRFPGLVEDRILWRKLRRAQDKTPTGRPIWCRADGALRPRYRWPGSSPYRAAAALHLCDGRCYLETHACRANARSRPHGRADSAAGGYEFEDAYCGS